jgi:hypothetical protein
VAQQQEQKRTAAAWATEIWVQILNSIKIDNLQVSQIY